MDLFGVLRVLIDRIREAGGAKEIHVRVACPPIVAPCFYGIDMSTIDELFAPRLMRGRELTWEVQDEMAAELGADSLRYLPVSAVSTAISKPAQQLCQACITGEYPTPCGQGLYQIALSRSGTSHRQGRTYEAEAARVT